MRRDENGIPYFTVIDLTKYFGVGESCIRQLLKTRKLDRSKAPNGTNRIYLEQVNDMVEKYGAPIRTRETSPHWRGKI